MYWYFAVLKKYAVFAGRARRKEYWLFNLIVGGIEFALIIAAIFIWIYTGHVLASYLVIPIICYNIIVLPPSIAVTTRRLHDTNRTGYWMFLSMIPLFGSFAMLVFMLLNGHKGTNRFGPNPKEEQKSEISPAIAPDGTPEVPWD